MFFISIYKCGSYIYSWSFFNLCFINCKLENLKEIGSPFGHWVIDMFELQRLAYFLFDSDVLDLDVASLPLNLLGRLDLLSSNLLGFHSNFTHIDSELVDLRRDVLTEYCWPVMGQFTIKESRLIS